MDTLGYGEGFRQLTKPVGDKSFRLTFLQNVKDVISKDRTYSRNNPTGNRKVIEITDIEAIEYTVQKAYEDSIREALCNSDKDRKYGDIKAYVKGLTKAEYGIVIGTLLYGLIQVNKVDVGENRKSIVKSIFQLQGLKDS